MSFSAIWRNFLHRYDERAVNQVTLQRSSQEFQNIESAFISSIAPDVGKFNQVYPPIEVLEVIDGKLHYKTPVRVYYDINLHLIFD